MQFWELSKSLLPINQELCSRSCDFLHYHKGFKVKHSKFFYSITEATLNQDAGIELPLINQDVFQSLFLHPKDYSLSIPHPHVFLLLTFDSRCLSSILHQRTSTRVNHNVCDYHCQLGSCQGLYIIYQRTEIKQQINRKLKITRYCDRSNRWCISF